MDWVGIPYANRGRDIKTGLDCWGLLIEFYRRTLGIELPSYEAAYDNSSDMNQTVNAIKYEKKDFDWKKVASPAYGDAILLRVLGHPCHVGVYLGDGRMLHTLTGHDSAIESIEGYKWKNRIDGFYRHSQRIGKAEK